MPTYEYQCNECNQKFEIFQSITADRLTTCPECKKTGLKRLIGSGAGIIFKGNGFYCTDYRSDSYEKDKKKDISKADKPDCPKASGKESKNSPCNGCKCNQG
jgi:putative FmdB family regulatory protein